MPKLRLSPALASDFLQILATVSGDVRFRKCDQCEASAFTVSLSL